MSLLVRRDVRFGYRIRNKKRSQKTDLLGPPPENVVPSWRLPEKFRRRFQLGINSLAGRARFLPCAAFMKKFGARPDHRTVIFHYQREEQIHGFLQSDHRYKAVSQVQIQVAASKVATAPGRRVELRHDSVRAFPCHSLGEEELLSDPGADAGYRHGSVGFLNDATLGALFRYPGTVRTEGIDSHWERGALCDIEARGAGPISLSQFCNSELESFRCLRAVQVARRSQVQRDGPVRFAWQPGSFNQRIHRRNHDEG